MNNDLLRLRDFFYKSPNGNEPVREWLKSLPKEDRKTIGEDIKTVQIGWPFGMPVVRKLNPGIWEVRLTLRNRITRILFTVGGNEMILLHGFIKKSKKTIKSDLDTAKRRANNLRGKLG